ncbi:MAG: hypothetical protein AB7R55_12625 [Gemmatimonadales bacterium]
MSQVFFTDRDLGNLVPDLLRRAGIPVERHSEHFAPDAKDVEWLGEVAGRGWYVLTRDGRIRYKPNELAAVMTSGLGLFVLVGKARHGQLAANVINTMPRVLGFIARTDRPFIAKVYRPSPPSLLRRADSPGRVELWMDGERWRRGRG